MSERFAARYDVIIVGAGPAGIFAALQLSHAKGVSILLLEKGKDIDGRVCPANNKGTVCPPCQPCGKVSGWGGAGAFSDGKLTLSLTVGGRLKEILGAERTEALIQQVDDIYLGFGAPEQVFGVGAEVERLVRRASLCELKLIPVKLRHLGTERCREVLKALRERLDGKVELRLDTSVARVLVKDGTAVGVETGDGQLISCTYLIVAPGREGSDWLVKQGSQIGLKWHNNPIDVGVRVELPSAVMEELTNVLYESKLEFYSKTFDDRIRTFCMCPYGEVTMESTGGEDPVTTVNGHSFSDRRTANTNFALLVSTTFTEPFREPIAYGRYIARLANILSGGVLVQRLGDLMEGRRSTPQRIERSVVEPTLKSAIPGDLSFVLPYRYLQSIVEMINAMDKLAPGVASRHTLLYGVEVKFYSLKLKLNENLETEVHNLFAIGDGAGVSRGLVQASACGLVAGWEVLKRLDVKPSLPVKTRSKRSQ